MNGENSTNCSMRSEINSWRKQPEQRHGVTDTGLLPTEHSRVDQYGGNESWRVPGTVNRPEGILSNHKQTKHCRVYEGSRLLIAP